MKEKFAPLEIEKAVQERWAQAESFLARDDDPRPKYFSMSMWPYPSGDLHVGHLRNYAIGDLWARHQRMKGYNVLQAMGWDAFGKDAELKARKLGIHPAKWIEQNTGNMRRELKALGFLIDWTRELCSCNPLYYYWEQVLFLKMWEKDLVHYAPTKVLWDKATQTVTSRRDIEDGKVARDDVEMVEMPAYLMRLRKYAGELLEGLDQIRWPDKIVKDQQYLIGRSEGMSMKFKLQEPAAGLAELEVYTTRPDTVMGVTYMAVHAEHPLARHAAASSPEVAAFCEHCAQILPMDAGNPLSEKKGVPLDAVALNPVSGEPIPVWIADYVVDDYGSGALMGVPAHDDRDFNFATKYQLPIKRVNARSTDAAGDPLERAETEPGVAVNSGPLDGLDKEGCIAKLEELLGPAGMAWRDHGLSLRDWPINRRMYWGTPIPLIVCEACGHVPVPLEDLPVVLPLDDACFENGLENHADFVDVPCPRCGAPAKRETDTMDTFVNSAWYYARYTCRDSADRILDDRAARWLPCDHYFGGDEHAQGHLVYARFIHKVMRDLGMHPGDCGDEPFLALLCQGMVLGADRKKMSKSQDNTVMAKDILDELGADTARMYIVGIGNPKDSFPWNDEHVHAHAKFLAALWELARARREQVAAGEGKEPEAGNALALNKLLRRIDMNIADQRFNNLVFGGIHEIFNLVKGAPEDLGLQRRGFTSLLKALNLVSPHIAEELWKEFGFDGLLIDASWWPEIRDEDLQEDSKLFVVQVNGKRRDEITVPVSHSDEQVLAEASQLKNIARHLEGKTIVKQRVIRPRNAHGIVSFVAEG